MKSRALSKTRTRIGIFEDTFLQMRECKQIRSKALVCRCPYVSAVLCINTASNLISFIMSINFQVVIRSSLVVNRGRINSIRFKSVNKSRMSSGTQDINDILRNIFVSGVNAVRPHAIFNSERFNLSHHPANKNIMVKVKDVDCIANGNVYEFNIASDKRCHLVGFGKAVLGMAAEMDRVLGERLLSGIISVPLGTVQQFSNLRLPAKITVLEGARNNLPDAQAVLAAHRIKSYVKRLNKDDVLFVLITGGGSALLPMPCDGVSLLEKCDIIKQLAARGANINNINTVRTDLSEIKGGKLAIAAANVHQVIALIISDIINNPIHLIASGPTVAHADAEGISSQATLETYNLWKTLPTHIQKAIATNANHRITATPANVKNFIIANNRSAVNEAMREADAHGLVSVCISTKIDGVVGDLSDAYTSLAIAIIKHRAHQMTTNDFRNQLKSIDHLLHFDDNFEANILAVIHNVHHRSHGICLIGGGEPTVQITGHGTGGRNQELALRFSIKCYENDILQDVVFLSAGTDGIDGTCDNTKMIDIWILF